MATEHAVGILPVVPLLSRGGVVQSACCPRCDSIHKIAVTWPAVVVVGLVVA